MSLFCYLLLFYFSDEIYFRKKNKFYCKYLGKTIGIDLLLKPI